MVYCDASTKSSKSSQCLQEFAHRPITIAIFETLRGKVHVQFSHSQASKTSPSPALAVMFSSPPCNQDGSLSWECPCSVRRVRRSPGERLCKPHQSPESNAEKKTLVKVSFKQETTTILKYGRNYGSVYLDGTGPRFARKNLKAQAEHA